MTDPETEARRARHAALRAEYAEEEAAAAAEEIAENEQAALSLRVPTVLADALKTQAAKEHIPTSALVRRILTQAMEQPSGPALTVAQVEEIARRVCRDEEKARRAYQQSA